MGAIFGSLDQIFFKKKKDGVPINATMDRFVIFFEYAKKENSGTYRCNATNRVASAVKEYSVYVSEPDVHKGVLAVIVIIGLVVIVLVGILVKKIRADKVKQTFTS